MKKLIPAILLFAIIMLFNGCTQQAGQNNTSTGNNTATGVTTVNASQIIQTGDTIKVEYKGTLQDGSEFDSSQKHGEPLEFKAGTGQMIKGFDEAVIGMRLNEEKTVTLSPDKAYGYSDNSRIVEIKKENIQGFEDLTVGMQISSPEAGIGTIKQIKTDSAIIDFNHPLAGKTLTFWIKIANIQKAK